MLARAKRPKRRPAGGGGDKAKPAADDDADDDAPDETSSTWTDKPSASDKADEADEPRKRAPPAKAARPGSGAKMEPESDRRGGRRTLTRRSARRRAEQRRRRSESSESRTAPTALEIGFGAKALFRQLVWTADADAAGLGPYSLSPGPQTGAWLEFYPAAFGSSGFGANVGIYGSLNYGFGVSTTTRPA